MTQPISPAELVMNLLETELDAQYAPGGIIVGPLNDAQQQAGAIQLVDAGMPRQEMYAPVVWDKVQIRCIAHSLAQADTMARAVFAVLNQHGRAIAEMVSTGDRYLIHTINIIAGPSMHYDTPETHETLLFAEVMIGLDPVG